MMPLCAKWIHRSRSSPEDSPWRRCLAARAALCGWRFLTCQVRGATKLTTDEALECSRAGLRGKGEKFHRKNHSTGIPRPFGSVQKVCVCVRVSMIRSWQRGSNNRPKQQETVLQLCPSPSPLQPRRVHCFRKVCRLLFRVSGVSWCEERAT